MKKSSKFGRKIRIALAERDMSGEELAQKIGCTRACINLYIQGKRKNRSMIEKIEDALKIEFEKGDDYYD